MSDFETPPPDPERELTDDLETLDPEAPSDSPIVHPPREDADRPVPPLEEPAEELQQENAATSLDQPSDSVS